MRARRFGMAAVSRAIHERLSTVVPGDFTKLVEDSAKLQLELAAQAVEQESALEMRAAYRSQFMLDKASAVALLEAEQQVRALAPVDSLSFNAYVLRDEETGARIVNEPVHEAWHQFLDEERRAIIWAHVDAGKTFSIAVGRVLFELGRNPRLRVAIISATDGQAQKVCRALAKYIEESAELHEVFPNLKRARNMPWTGHQLFVQGHTSKRDPSVVTAGLHSRGVVGSRYDLVIFDDVLNYENVRSETQRADVRDWVRSTVDGRMTRHSRCWYLGMVWDAEDWLHEKAAGGVYKSKRFPAITDDGQLGQPTRWPQSRIDAAKAEMGPIEFDRQVLCKTVASGEKRFKVEWVRACQARGEGTDMAYALADAGVGNRVFTGVDLGVRDGHSSALTALFTLLVKQNGDKQVLCCESGKWSGPEIVKLIIDTHRRFGSIVLVENVAAQEFLLQFIRRESAVPIRPFQTSGRGEQLTNVNHPEWGFEAMGIEMFNSKWIIPSRGGRSQAEIEAWISELVYWERGKHVGDRAMASWIASQGSREQPKKKVRRFRQSFTQR